MKLKNYILLTISTLTLAGCTSEDITNTPDEERIPLRLEATLSGDRPVTRAYDNVFEKGDKLLSYVQHVYKSGSDYSAVTGVQASLVTFTKGSVAMEGGTEISDLTPGTALYWDDFSNSSSADTDLRTSDHGLRSYYGYCFNGTDVKDKDFDKPNGKVTWMTTDDQSAAEDFKKNDLLWSETQTPVSYDHATASSDIHGTLKVPFTHAMSKFTIVLVAGEGFASTDLSSATVTLSGMNSKGTFTAPTSKVTVDVPTDDTTTVKMYGNTASTTTDNKPCRAYEAVVVPITALTKNNLLATIEGMSGNTYKVYITDDILTKWSENAALNEGKTQSGFNYKLTVTLNKQAVSVVASLADWTSVNAEGTGEIQFTANVTSSSNTTTTSSNLSNGTFKLWKISDLTETALAAAKTTTVTYDGSAYTYNPTLYWQNATDNSYFRAMATMTTTESSTSIAAPTTTDVNQNIDLLWGTTADHTGKEADNATTHHYDEGAAINPRTGEVPLVFKHAMSKVVFDLKTTDETTDPQYVDLSYATIELTNLATSGTISIANGSITLGSIATSAITGVKSKESKIMVPQEIGSTAVLKINLNDNTTAPTKSTSYSLSLADCENTDGKITEWESGKQYTYTITLKKEAVKFRVLVQDWTETKGSGNATLDWD